MSERKRLAIFGSTGSIGKSTLELVRRFPEEFEVVALVANSRIDELAMQAKEFKPAVVGLADTARAAELASLSGTASVLAGNNEIAAWAGEGDYDLMIAAVVGFAGLRSVLAAVRAGKDVALANKESLVAAGRLVLEEAGKSGARLIPVDSEHSAIFQLLTDSNRANLHRIILTASGGPFLDTPLEEFGSIQAEQAIKHPRWQMGPKISLDSATMFNKALELIEARWLFDIAEDHIDVVIHPQSIVHSMICLTDGSYFAQLSQTDMQGPISFALRHPEKRLHQVLQPLDFRNLFLEFREPDPLKFPAIALARAALRAGEGACCVLNTANEAAGEAFFRGQIAFNQISRLVSQALEEFGSLNYCVLQDLIDLDAAVGEFIKNQKG